MHAQEWQFDGLVGPTHNYAGLAMGNLAAQNNAGEVSNPRQAALQGLEKMRFVQSLGVPQAFLPPHYRPLTRQLRRLGFSGSAGDMLQQAGSYSRGLLASVYSSSFMWTANAATITPSADTGDGKLHITPANMSSHYHRAIESKFSYRILSNIFHNPEKFVVNRPLFTQENLGDEGAANHMLVCNNHGDYGVHVFVYGESHLNPLKPVRFPARQQRLASEAIARLHKINPKQSVFVQQSPAVIDQGVFHNDVIAMNTTRHMIAHEAAFTPEDRAVLQSLNNTCASFRYREIREGELSVSDAVATYLFNSQLLDIGGDNFVLIAPQEAETNGNSSAVIQKLIAEGLLTAVHYKDLRESMRNGGGPACLRLRVVMTPEESAAMHPGIVLTHARYAALKQWVETHYRDRMCFEDLRDPELLNELNDAYLALESIIDMPGLYREEME